MLAPRNAPFFPGLTSFVAGLALFAVLASGCFDRTDIPTVPIDGSPGGPDVPEHVHPGSEAFVVGHDIRALATSSEKLFFTEYGTRDSLGNYLDDGVLYAKPLGGGAVETIATGLSGPIELEVTDAHAYVLVDAYPRPQGVRVQALLRVPLAGGAPLFIEEHVASYFTRDGSLVTHGGTACWRSNESGELVVRTLTDAETAPRTLAIAGNLAAMDATHLYVRGEGSYIHRIPLAGGSVEVVGNTSLPFAVGNDEIVGLETAHDVGIAPGTYVLRSAVGEVPSRVAYIGQLGDVFRVRIDDGWFYGLYSRWDAAQSIFFDARDLSNPEPSHVHELGTVAPRAWAPSRVGVFYTYGTRIDLAPR